MNGASAGVVSAGRRAFLKWSTAVGGVMSALLAGLPAARAFLSPAFRRKSEEEWVRLGDVDSFEIGAPVKIDFVSTVKDAWVETRVLRNVWLYTEDGEKFTVYNGRCTHLGCSFGYDATKKLFRCPCHNGMFDVKSGAVLGGPPPRPLDVLQSRVENGALFAQYRDYRLGVAEKVAV